MYIERIPNRNSPPAILLRESYRDGPKVRKRTLANLTHWPSYLVEGLQTLLHGGLALPPRPEAFEIVRSRPHGHVAAVLGTVRRLGLEPWICPTPCRERTVVLALICARILAPRSKLATARGLAEESCSSSLGELLGMQAVDEEALYAAMDWLLARQADIEATLARHHLTDGTLILYDLTSTYFEGRTCPLAKFGYSRDGKKGKLQIVVGLLCDARGCPIAVQVFPGNTQDATTVRPQLDKLRTRFGLTRIVLVGDRGVLTTARIREDLRGVEGLDWITALTAPAIHKLVEAGTVHPVSGPDFDLAEVDSPEYPDERLLVCYNPGLAQEQARKREALLRATEEELDKIVVATTRAKRALQGAETIGIRVGKVLNRFKVGKYFTVTITARTFAYQRQTQRIADAAALDGVYIIRTSVPRTVLGNAETVAAYKGLSVVEQAFRSLKTIDLKVRPIYHHLADRVRAHVFLCMLAYYVAWHMRRRLAPLLFEEDDIATAQALRPSPVAPARPSPRAQRKASTKQTADGLPVHSFQTLLADLATIVKNRIQVQVPGQAPAAPLTFDRITRPTPVQQRALDLLGVSLECTQEAPRY
jgi:transposase